jgi:hypothetical protein
MCFGFEVLPRFLSFSTQSSLCSLSHSLSLSFFTSFILYTLNTALSRQVYTANIYKEKFMCEHTEHLMPIILSGVLSTRFSYSKRITHTQRERTYWLLIFTLQFSILPVQIYTRQGKHLCTYIYDTYCACCVGTIGNEWSLKIRDFFNVRHTHLMFMFYFWFSSSFQI